MIPNWLFRKSFKSYIDFVKFVENVVVLSTIHVFLRI